MTEGKVIHIADSFYALAELEDGEVDVVLTDPPYNAHVHSNMSSGTAMKQSKGGGIPRIALYYPHVNEYAFARDLVRVAKRWALSFCAVEDFGSYRDVNPSAWVRAGLWIKPNAMGQLTGDRPAAAYEGLAIMHRPGKKRWNGRGSYGYWMCNGTRGEKGRHPNQKPLNLCLELVAKFTEPGEIVFDPFAGSGRIGEACLLLGRRYIGWDSSQEWVDKANERLSKVSFGSMRGEDCMRLCAYRKV